MAKGKLTSVNESVVAKSDDGTIQLTFTIPFNTINAERTKALKHLGESLTVPGFRKGMAPLEKVSEHVKDNELLEHTLSHIVPNMLSEAVKKHNIKPIIYPKFDLVSAEENKDWQIRATTCESPDVKIGEYKKFLKSVSGSAIWTPDKGAPDKNVPKGPTTEEKEQQILKSLLDNIHVKIPSILVDEEVNNRLSNLLSRIEKLGLSLESYLKSAGKTAEKLREEYKKQSEEGLALDFILNEIALKENLQVEKSEIDMSIKAASQDPKLKEDLDTPERRRFIEAIIKRRKALDYLLSLT